MASASESTPSSSSSASPSRVIDSAASAAHGLVDKAVDATLPAARWLGDKESYMQDQMKATCDYVAAHPFKALGIAFVAGLLIGRITA
jgi:ElaB/YqjD/DUF883 family membrane-anchored ribosome-binding protein